MESRVMSAVAGLAILKNNFVWGDYCPNSLCTICFWITILYGSCGDWIWLLGQVAEIWLIKQWVQLRLFFCFLFVFVLYESVTENDHSLLAVVVCCLNVACKTMLGWPLHHTFWLYICVVGFYWATGTLKFLTLFMLFCCLNDVKVCSQFMVS